MTKSKERLYAEHCLDQNMEAFADELRRLLADDKPLFITLNEALNRDNLTALDVLSRLSYEQRLHIMQYIIPAARIGLSVATFKMEDKYSG